jgi:hypothetical protein
MDNALRACPRLDGANIGALAGLLVSASGCLLYAAFGTGSDFIVIGLLMAVCTLFAGFTVAPAALRGRWRMLGAGILVTLVSILGAGAITVAWSALAWPGSDLVKLMGMIAEWFIGIGVMVGVAWIVLLRAVRLGDRLRAAFAVATALGFVWVAALIESRLLGV